ncbi:MAG: AIR synthase family protein [Desulfurococcales archaeon]|nr:AIR synthase family protein [Desulfurococcales archaeon]
MGGNVIGKVSRKVFEEIIYPRLGLPDPSIKVGPKFGVDFTVIELGNKDLIVEVDPVFVVPEYGWDRSSWFAVHILASDVAVSGVPPKYLFIDLNLPLSMSEDEFRTLWEGIHKACTELGISIAAGHTGRYGGVDYPMIGGATMVGVTDKGNYVTPEMAEPGDAVIMTKGAAVETAGILATMFPDVLERRFGPRFAEEARNIFWLQSVVKDALTLAKVGLRTGVTAMHDATEYGVWGALHDVAEASGVGIVVHEEKLFMREDVRKVVEAFSSFTGIDVDPYAAISEGTLIATVKPSKVEEALKLLRDEGIEAEVIGEVVEGRGVKLVREDGSEEEVRVPEKDPFWEVFFKTLDIIKGGEG